MTMRSSITAARISGPRREADGVVVFEFRFAPDDLTFAGHFPTRPLLPGVFQLEMARAAAEWALDRPLTVREVSKAKFLRPILPDEIVRAELSWSEAGDALQLRAGFSVGEELASEMVLRLWRSD
jgi:3-hydroxymyristoyl/3-hydroxydecanoyl-(acyl carrier protein) dehydratase